MGIANIAEVMTMSKAEREIHRKVAILCFNKAWDHLEMKTRSPDDEREMLLLAHASRYHWGLVGTPTNKAVGDWQISRIYAVLGQADLALRFAKSSLSISEKNGLAEIIPSAYEGIARAYATARDWKQAEENLAKARKKLEKLALENKDREVYLGQIDDTQRLIDRLQAGQLFLSRLGFIAPPSWAMTRKFANVESTYATRMRDVADEKSLRSD
jgi:tetratricopeptide (TPR) repeat protein